MKQDKNTVESLKNQSSQSHISKEVHSYICRYEVYPKIIDQKSFSMSLSEQKNLLSLKQNISLSFNESIQLKALYKIPTYILKIETLNEDQSNHSIEEKLNLKKRSREVLIDTIIEDLVDHNHLSVFSQFLKSTQLKSFFAIEVKFKPGVTDNVAHSVKEAFQLLPEFTYLNKNDLNGHSELEVRSGYTYLMGYEVLNEQNTHEQSEVLLSRFQNEIVKSVYATLANDLLHDVEIHLQTNLTHFVRFQNIHWSEVKSLSQPVKYFNLNISDEELLKLNRENCWAFSLPELKHIQNYYNEKKSQPTDVEIEVLAQSWSEHCKHKIFQAEIDYNENQVPAGMKAIGTKKIKSLFKTYIRGATEKIKKDRQLNWLISVFHDNAGIVRFDENIDVCIKVETHNSPSALDPYGGALTGILGVNRDILGCGQGAKPIGNTNVFCLAEESYFKSTEFKIKNLTLPPPLKNPDRIAEGVHLGVQDGGNKSGIPTVNGAFYYHPQFVGKPLVYCGTIGVLPQTEHQMSTAEKRHLPCDLIVMSGGRIGKDGIHGATFSSMELNEFVPSSVVQIGDPITQKRLMDFLLEARKQNLFTSVTDNGAGGLSSSIGEMSAHTHGAEVDLALAPTKYPGLSPFEIMVSESQERMTFAVSPNKIDAFMQLSKKRNVESTVVGQFTNSGVLKINYGLEKVAELSLDFLHESLLPMQLKAEFSESAQLNSKKLNWFQESSVSQLTSHSQGFLNSKISESINLDSIKQTLFNLLSSGQIRSHEHLVRRYDHEVQASTVVKPFTGDHPNRLFGPTDAGVLWLGLHGGQSDNALSVSCGLQPALAQVDAYLSAVASVDEAVRNAICVGTDPDQMVLVDNFCWPDPLESLNNPDAHYKLAQLVRTSEALYDMAVQYGMPFVSGKDSMKNDYIFEKTKISVLPTILVTAMGRVPNINNVVTSEVKNKGDLVVLLSRNVKKQIQNFSEWKFEFDENSLKQQILFYKNIYQCISNQLIESAHDVSDGGLLISIVEKCFSTVSGILIDLFKNNSADSFSHDQWEKFLFSEVPGQIVITIKPENLNHLIKLLGDENFLILGEVIPQPKVIMQFNNENWQFSHSETQLLFRKVALSHLSANKNNISSSGVLSTENIEQSSAHTRLRNSFSVERTPEESSIFSEDIFSETNKFQKRVVGKKVSVLVITGDGVNCENETAFAFDFAGATSTIMNINDVLSQPKIIHQFGVLALPGGFSFGDDISSGQILGLKLKYGLQSELKTFVDEKKLIIGICNGFQTLIKLGLLPDPNSVRMATLTHNRQGHFINQWAQMKFEDSNCIWTKNLDKNIILPIRHGEGKIVFAGDELTQSETYRQLLENKQIVLKYNEDVNGSYQNIAGLTDPSGCILGLMPHPEAFINHLMNPMGKYKVNKAAPGLRLFINAVDYCLERGFCE